MVEGRSDRMKKELSRALAEYPSAELHIRTRSEDRAIRHDELLKRAEALAVQLREIPVHSRILLLSIKDPLPLIETLIATLLAGGIPGILESAPAPQTTAERVWRRFQRMKGCVGLLTDDAGASELDIPFSREITWDGGRLVWMRGEDAEGVADTDACFLQFSSGTTGPAKSVALTDSAILACVDRMNDAFDLRPEDVVINPLPLSHDFGVFAGLLMPLLNGVSSVQLSPEYWSRNPSVLMETISSLGGTLCWLPNSGFERCTRFARQKRLEGVDLSSIRLWINGAEPVLRATRKRFLDRFQPFGLQSKALATGYGMSENTLGVTFSGLDKAVNVTHVRRDLVAETVGGNDSRDESGTLAVVSCGQPMPGVELEIRNKEGGCCPEGVIGEILVRSDSLFSGYLDDPAGTATVMTDGWLKTGDLGFLSAGELYYCGRLKDLMILGGRNVHPDEVEVAIMAGTDLLPDQVAVFSVLNADRGTETMVVALAGCARLGVEWRELEKTVRAIAMRASGAVPEYVLSVKRGWIRRTGSGKRDRASMRKRFLSDRDRGQTWEKG